MPEMGVRFRSPGSHRTPSFDEFAAIPQSKRLLAEIVAQPFADVLVSELEFVTIEVPHHVTRPSVGQAADHVPRHPFGDRKGKAPLDQHGSHDASSSEG